MVVNKKELGIWINSVYCACQHPRSKHENDLWTCQVCGDLNLFGKGCSTFRPNCVMNQSVQQINNRENNDSTT